MYTTGDKMLEVRELLIKAFATAWRMTDQSLPRDHYITSCVSVIVTLQIQPELIYGEEGQGLVDDELDHLADLVRADGCWVYYAVPKENYFMVVWMPDTATAQERVTALRSEGEGIACVVDLAESWPAREHL